MQYVFRKSYLDNYYCIHPTRWPHIEPIGYFDLVRISTVRELLETVQFFNELGWELIDESVDIDFEYDRDFERYMRRFVQVDQKD